MATLFFSYAHHDESLRDQLEKQLSILKRQGELEVWHDRRIGAGEELDSSIGAHVEQDEIILLLVSPDFLASNYCYDREMLRAMERHDAGHAVVIPVILRPCDWHMAPFGKLRATPTDGRAITTWPNLDEAMLVVARDIRAAAEKVNARRRAVLASQAFAPLGAERVAAMKPRGLDGPRSSNMRLTKEFSERDLDKFKAESFEYIARYFENSLHELEARNAGIEGSFRRIDANRFTAAIYRSGKAIARCTIFMGGDRFMGSGISYVDGETTASNGHNEILSVKADDQAMFMESMGMRMTGSREGQLSQEGAAELYWTMLIEPLQRGYR